MSSLYAIVLVASGITSIIYTLKKWNTDQIIFPIKTVGKKIYKDKQKQFLSIKNASGLLIGIIFLISGILSHMEGKESTVISLLVMCMIIIMISDRMLMKYVDLGKNRKNKYNKKR